MSNTTTLPAAVAAPSRHVARKALGLAVKQTGNGRFAVSSGTEPGTVYTVLDECGDSWACNCVGTRECSHLWAARASVDPAIKRMLRQLSAPKPRGRKGGA